MGIAAVGVGVSAATGIAGAVMSGGAVDKGQQQANQTQQKQIAYDKANFQPYLDAGKNALGQLGNLNGLNGQDAATAAMGAFQSSPGYGYQVSQGLNAVDHGAAAAGMLRSGATLRAEQTLGSNLADQNFGQYYGRLSGLAQLGQSSAAGASAATGQQSQGIASTDASAGTANASIYGSAAKALGGAANSYLGSYSTSPTMQNNLASLFS